MRTIQEIEEDNFFNAIIIFVLVAGIMSILFTSFTYTEPIDNFSIFDNVIYFIGLFFSVTISSAVITYCFFKIYVYNVFLNELEKVINK